MSEDTGNQTATTLPFQRTQSIDSPIDDDRFDVLSSIDASPVTKTNLNNVNIFNGGGDNNASESKGGEDEALPETEETTETTEGEIAEGEPEGEVIPDAKLVTAIMGDKSFDVPEDAVIKFKVDGKEVEATISELRRNYQGKIPWERHYGETKALEKQLKEREHALNQGLGHVEARLKDIMDTFETNPYLAFEKIAVLKGKNPADYLPLYIAQSRKTLEELQKLSEAEYNSLLLQKRTNHERTTLEESRKQHELSQKQQKKSLDTQEADLYFAGKIHEHGFTEEEISRSTKILQDSGEDLNSYAPKQIADLLTEYITTIDRKYTKIDAAIRKVDESLLEDREFINNLGQLTNSSFTTEEIEEIIRTYLGDSTPKGLKPKAKTSSKAKLAKESSSGKQTPQKIPPKIGKSKMNGNSGEKDVGPLSINDILRDYNF